jgi:hypothetical protein
MLFFGQDLGHALSEREGFPAADLHLPHEKEPDTDENNHRKPGDEDVLPERSFFFLLGIDCDLLFSDDFYHLGVFGCIGFEPFSLRILPDDTPALCLNLEDPITFNGIDEIRIIFIRNCLAWFVEEVKEENHDDNND